MVVSIYTYALIKAMYDKEEDYIDSFWPIVVKEIPSNQSVTSSFVKTQLKQSFDLDMPIHVLDVILTRAEGKGHLRHWRDRTAAATKYRLTNAGINFSARLETDKEVERRMNALLDNMKHFFEGKGVSLSFDKIRELLLYFVHKNIDTLTECLNPSISPTQLAPLKFSGSDTYLFEYIKSAEHQKPTHYKTLEDIVLGSIISVLLRVDEPAEITEIRTKQFSNCQVFLDTNFVFSTLGLDRDEFNKPAKELFKLLERQNFNLKVFSFTIDEICRVVSSYPEESYRYPTNIRIDTLYSSLKTKGWSKTDAIEFIINIEQILQQKGIAIELVKDINLSKYTPDEKLMKKIKKYKPGQNEFHRNHDLAAIEKIKDLREKNIRRIEDSRALFLTSDYRLSRFDFIEDGHKLNATICETVLDRLMTNILWLKNPNIKLSLNTIIGAHSRGLFVNRGVWNRFYEVLQELKKEGKIKDDDIGTLFWHNYLEDTLRSIEEEDAKKITQEFVLDEIETAQKLREEAIKKQMEGIGKAKEEEMKMELMRKEKEFSEALKQSISDAESRIKKEWLDKVQRAKEEIRKISEVKAGRWSNIITFLLAPTFIAATIVAFLLIPYEILDLFFALSGTGGVLGLWKLRPIIRNRLTKRIRRKKLQEAKLDRIT